MSKYIYQEDDALNNGKDPDYGGIADWWRETFGRKFYEDWKQAAATELDGGDQFTRTITVAGGVYKVTHRYDGYFVEKAE